MPTLNDIAEATGVHKVTVSKILNGGVGNTRVSEKKAERVRRVAAELGYVRNLHASRLRTSASTLVGFATGDPRNPFFAEWMMLIEEGLREKGLELVTAYCHADDPESIRHAILNLCQQGTKALVYWSEIGPVDNPVRRSDSSPPIIHMGTMRSTGPGLWFDLREGLREAVAHLVGHGAARIGFHRPQSAPDESDGASRQSILREICAERSLPAPFISTYEGESWNVEAAAAGAARLSAKDADGWIGFNDVASLGLLMQLPGIRNRPPAVVSIDGSAPIRAWSPAIPHLGLCRRDYAEHLIRLLIGGSTNPTPPTRLAPRLIKP